ncbi:MAG: hypothetical protein P4L34_07470 [Paludibacter sp.]|nr:hypothetical protein [Paludibacter sp.]
MKKHKRFIQATVVILIVGIGYVHNLDKKSYLYQELNTASVIWENNSTNPDTMQVNDSKLFNYTKKIINSGIQHLISKI